MAPQTMTKLRPDLEYSKRPDGKFNIWRLQEWEGTPKWMLVGVTKHPRYQK